MLAFDYGSPYLWDKIVLTKFISGFASQKLKKLKESESLSFCPTKGKIKIVSS